MKSKTNSRVGSKRIQVAETVGVILKCDLTLNVLNVMQLMYCCFPGRKKLTAKESPTCLRKQTMQLKKLSGLDV